jgi:tetratricopeptide (TPR) repeat protein
MLNRFLLVMAAMAALGAAPLASAATVDEDVMQLQRQWDVVRYRTPAEQQSAKYEALVAQAEKVVAAHPGRAEPLIWQGIIESSLAGVKKGFGALGLAKQARAHYEAAMKIAPNALDGSAYNSLGVLYYRVPGWPIGFGDKDKAGELLQKALAINPKGIDPNYFYGEYLVETGRNAEAVPCLEKALAAPARPGREIADAGRREEAKALLAKLRQG